MRFEGGDLIERLVIRMWWSKRALIKRGGEIRLWRSQRGGDQEGGDPNVAVKRAVIKEGSEVRLW